MHNLKWIIAGAVIFLLAGCEADKRGVSETYQPLPQGAEKPFGYPYDFTTVMAGKPRNGNSIEEIMQPYADALGEICLNLNDDIGACEMLIKIRDAGVVAKTQPPPVPIFKLRDHYIEQCRTGEGTGCTALPGLLYDEFGMKRANRKNKEIDDGDRLWWRDCLMWSEESCEIIEKRNIRYGYDYEATLRADQAAGGQEELFERITTYTGED